MATTPRNNVGVSTTRTLGEDRTRQRNTATFTPYFWEAYNEIVQPRRFNHYLITKWLAPLGPVAFAVVLALRDMCYHNRETGVLRNTCRVDMGDLAAITGKSERTLQREFADNETLALFVRRVKQYRMNDENKPEQAANKYEVCMDDPIHPDDYEAYDLLRAQKEADRVDDAWETPRGRQNDALVKSGAERERQNDTLARQFVTPMLSDNLSPQMKIDPPGVISKELTTPGPGEIPPINSPQGERESHQEKVLKNIMPEKEATVWSGVIAILAAQVQAGEINQPTWHGHLTRLRLGSLTETAEGVQAVIIAPSAFTKDWVEKRFTERIRAALACVMGREAASVTIEFRSESQ